MLSCNANSDLTKTVDIVSQYVKKNNLPINIGKETTVINDFDITGKTNFLLFIMDLSNSLANSISEGNYTDETIANYQELQNIISGFYNSCLGNNYELAIIFTNTGNENKIIVDFLEYHNYNLTFSNNFIILDNNTTNAKLGELVLFLDQLGGIKRNNVYNYFIHFINNEQTFTYEKILLVDGKIQSIDSTYYIIENDMVSNDDLDLALETVIMNVSYHMIDSIIYLLKIKEYGTDEYTIINEENKRKLSELQKIIDDYYKSNQ
jgi:hypothetical protein